MDADRYRRAIVECFDKLGKISPGAAEEFAPLKAAAAKETNQGRLFVMFQTLREIIAELGGDAKTEFFIENKEGVRIKVKSLAEAQEIAKTYSNPPAAKRT